MRKAKKILNSSRLFDHTLIFLGVLVFYNVLFDIKIDILNILIFTVGFSILLLASELIRRK
ncbi:hypothetical protein [Lederbergia lenta]|uniref:Uncharacterized protein n=1 Tax=Lederbergia lenta TaxID=1467 RepID=A0A2X4W4V1_LEDLE|nr:hypothetical protein [Lederbergia lenta]MEC2323538.1 hypothetical protein [Lederbergia lenta]SQI52620.1 Uncharacterised protein [Lederbergia lenta]